MAQVVECLPSKVKPWVQASTTKKKKKFPIKPWPVGFKLLLSGKLLASLHFYSHN
jgi:hypothetical protein